MPVTHFIDNESELIITTWDGEATDSTFKEALEKYHNDIKSNPKYVGYNEIVNLRKATPLKLTISGLLTIGRIASEAEKNFSNKKMALIVESDSALSLANLYTFYRNIGFGARKKICVFKDEEKAYNWIKGNT